MQQLSRNAKGKQPRKPTLASLMAKKLDGLTTSKAMQLIGTIIDMGGDEHSLAALDHASGMLDRLMLGEMPARAACRAHYFRANVWSAKRHASPNWRTWLWKSEAIDGEILELRRALAHPGFSELHPMQRAQIYTNLGNILNHTGRFIEAIEYWDRALNAVPKFAMASGNRGVGLGHYAGALYDRGHEAVLMLAACHSLAEACAEDAILDNPDNGAALEQFASRMTAIWGHYDIPRIAEDVDFENHSMGRSKKERAYRRWCLGNRLFINPLNDIGPHPISAHDVMTLPSITVGLEDGPGPPAVIHYFNIIKQEYCAARYALYEGMTAVGVHFSDRGVLLYNTLDYPAFGFAIERMKMAFRGAYSVFDKTAFLLNDYLNLGHPERQVNFRNLWYVKAEAKRFIQHWTAWRTGRCAGCSGFPRIFLRMIFVK
jgi:tetratricopeptide (TPR) repeat protein